MSPIFSRTKIRLSIRDWVYRIVPAQSSLGICVSKYFWQMEMRNFARTPLVCCSSRNSGNSPMDCEVITRHFSRACAKTTFREDEENYFRFRWCSYLLIEGLVLSQVEALLSVPTVVRELTTFLRIKLFFSISHFIVIPNALIIFLHPSLARTNLFYQWESDLHLMHSRPLLSHLNIFFRCPPLLASICYVTYLLALSGESICQIVYID